jgi:hypothetical protein
MRGGEVVAIRKVPSGFAYSGDPSARYKITGYTSGLSVLEYDREKKAHFVPKSLSTDFSGVMVKSPALHRELFDIARVLSVPLPFQEKSGGPLIYPVPGYDSRLGTYLISGAPELVDIPFKKALEVIDFIICEFCFTNDEEGESRRSRCHAIARILTPFAGILLGWTTRVPLWNTRFPRTPG